MPTTISTSSASSPSGMTLTTARNLIKKFARNVAGNSDEYADDAIDYALQFVGERFCRVTRCLLRADSLALTAASSDVPVGTLPGTFHPERLVSAYINGAKCPLRMVPWEDINRHQTSPGGSGRPEEIGFEDPAHAGVWPTPDIDYTLRVRWWEPFITWTPGVASGTADVLVLNLRPDMLHPILAFGAPSVLQHNEPQHKYAEKSWAKYLEEETRFMGAGDLGVRVSRRAIQE